MRKLTALRTYNSWVSLLCLISCTLIQKSRTQRMFILISHSRLRFSCFYSLNIFLYLPFEDPRSRSKTRLHSKSAFFCLLLYYVFYLLHLSIEKIHVMTVEFWGGGDVKVSKRVAFLCFKLLYEKTLTKNHFHTLIPLYCVFSSLSRSLYLPFILALSRFLSNKTTTFPIYF